MIVIHPYCELIHEENPFLKIEKVGRTCYKSSSEYTLETALKFYQMLRDRKHYGILEHVRFIFEIDTRNTDLIRECYYRPYFVCTEEMVDGKMRVLVSANLRALNEGRLACGGEGAIPAFLDAISEKYSPELDFAHYRHMIKPNYPIKVYRDISEVPNATMYEQRCHSEITVHFVLDRGISHEFVRHREFSFAQESTRYCNYSLDKFNKNITLVDPFFMGEDNSDARQVWYDNCRACEEAYFKLLDMGVTPQDARSVLPTCLKTELIMTGTLNMWKHFFDLRLYEKTGKAHPLAKISAEQAYKLIDERYAIKDNFNI